MMCHAFHADMQKCLRKSIDDDGNHTQYETGQADSGAGSEVIGGQFTTLEQDVFVVTQLAFDEFLSVQVHLVSVLYFDLTLADGLPAKHF
jgi:hypothetical protein